MAEFKNIRGFCTDGSHFRHVGPYTKHVWVRALPSVVKMMRREMVAMVTVKHVRSLFYKTSGCLPILAEFTFRFKNHIVRLWEIFNEKTDICMFTICLMCLLRSESMSDFVMEFAPFRSLAQFMIKHWGLRTSSSYIRRPRSWHIYTEELQAKCVARDVSIALFYMHEELNMVHRDVKPEVPHSFSSTCAW